MTTENKNKELKATETVKPETKKVTSVIKTEAPISRLKPSREMTNKDIASLQTIEVKLVKRVDNRNNFTSYNLFARLSNHATPRMRLDMSEYHLATSDDVLSKFDSKNDTIKGTETYYLKAVPIRLYRVIPNDPDKNPYSRINVYLAPGLYFTEYLKFAEEVLLKKENPNLKFIEVNQDTEDRTAESGGFGGW